MTETSFKMNTLYMNPVCQYLNNSKIQTFSDLSNDFVVQAGQLTLHGTPLVFILKVLLEYPSHLLICLLSVHSVFLLAQKEEIVCLFAVSVAQTS